MPDVPYPYEVNWQIGHKKRFLNTNLFLIKPFLITKFDCTSKYVCLLLLQLFYSFFKKKCACSHGTQFSLGSGFFAKPLLLLKCNNHVWEQNEGKVEWTSKGISVIQLRWVLFLDLSFFEPLYDVKALLIFWVQFRQILHIKDMLFTW